MSNRWGWVGVEIKHSLTLCQDSRYHYEFLTTHAARSRWCRRVFRNPKKGEQWTLIECSCTWFTDKAPHTPHRSPVTHQLTSTPVRRPATRISTYTSLQYLWRSLLKFRPWPLYMQGQQLLCPLARMMGGPHSRLKRCAPTQNQTPTPQSSSP